MNLKTKIEELSKSKPQLSHNEIEELSNEFLSKLNSGEIRAAEKKENIWIVNQWVKQGILLLFHYGKLVEHQSSGAFNFFDKDTLPLRPAKLDHNIRVVPGGSSIRSGAYVAKGVICMPPMYINIGAYVDEGTMIDSHALVGTCGQIGKRVHLSAASQIGGVLEPPGARPVIIEDDVLIGGNCGIYEGVLVRKGAVLASGVILTASTKVYDIVDERIIAPKDGHPLEIPENAVIVPGSRPVNTDFGRKNNLSIYTPLLIKYRDQKTDSKTSLEDILR